MEYGWMDECSLLGFWLSLFSNNKAKINMNDDDDFIIRGVDGGGSKR
jgi:hypothetical protein